MVVEAGSVPFITYSDVQGARASGSGWNPDAGTDGGNNIHADPLFVTTANPDTGAGDARLQTGSPAIDMGNNAFNSEPKDLAGGPRVLDGDGDTVLNIDMGAYERDTACLAPSAPQVTVALTGGRVELTWPAQGGVTYDVYRSTEPYFTPAAPYATNITAPWQDPDALAAGNPALNFTYIVRALGCATADSPRVGEFDFTLAPGQ
jgi:hypothetical protein